MADTPLLGMPEIAESQSSKYITHNEALRIIDALVHLAPIDKDLTSPPGSPSDGDLYIVGPSATGGWSGHDDDIAYYSSSSWIFITPQEGMQAWMQDEDSFYTFEGASAGWVQGSGLGATTFLGLTDTPSSYSGTNEYYVRVNSAGNALEFVAPPYDMGGYRNGKPGASEEIYRFVFVRGVDFADDFSGSRASAGTAANAETIFSIRKDGVEFGTMTFAASATTASFATDSAGESFAAGEVLSVVAPASPDSALADIAFTLLGARS